MNIFWVHIHFLKNLIHRFGLILFDKSVLKNLIHRFEIFRLIALS